MASDELFEDLPTASGTARAAGAARLREPERDQIELRVCDLDSLIPADHAARTIWAYVQQLDLRELEARIKAREHRPGQAPASPRLLLLRVLGRLPPEYVAVPERQASENP